MFQSPGHVARRQGKAALSRLEYLQRLVIEYQESQDLSVRQQVLANLCNFSYDPVNYEHLRALQVIPDLLLDAISESDLFTVRFALGGIANCCSDITNARLILEDEEGLQDILQCLSSADFETVMHSMAILLLLLDPQMPWTESDNISQFFQRVQQQATPCLKQYAQSDARVLTNLAQVILTRLENSPLLPPQQNEIPNQSQKLEEQQNQVADDKCHSNDTSQ